MKYVIALLITILCTNAHADIEPDKEKHLVVSATISSLLYLGFRKGGVDKTDAYMGAVGTTLAIGFIKELSDPIFDKEDLKCDAVGAFVAPLLFISF